jgi:hypothetical protein
VRRSLIVAASLCAFAVVVGPDVAHASGPTSSDEGPISVHDASELPAPVVLLEPRRTRSKELANLFERGPVVTGAAVSRRRVVVSTRGLAAALPAEGGASASPDRLARNALRAMRQQHWSVKGWDGVVRQGELSLILDGGELAVIELTEPLPELEPSHVKLRDGDARVIGVDAWGGELHLLEFEAQISAAGSGRAYVRAQLPTGFEGAAVFDRKGRWLGAVFGTSTAGAPVLLTHEAMTALVAESEADQRLELGWSIGAGLATSFVQRVRLIGRTAVIGRVELWLDRRWSFGLEAGWTSDVNERFVDDPTFTIVQRRRDVFPGIAIAQFMAGPRASRFRVAMGLGGGVHLSAIRDRTTALTVPSGCTSEDCPISGITEASGAFEADPIIAGGVDLVNFGPGPWGSLAGVRAGYRIHVSVPDVSRTTHMLGVMLQI